jgi:hypothetical protein
MTKWKKGTSGNPAGRPKGRPNKSTAEIKELIAERVPFEKLIDKLFALAMRNNVKAAECLLAYRFGRPSSADEITLHSVSTDTGLDANAKAAEWLKECGIELPERGNG